MAGNSSKGNSTAARGQSLSKEKNAGAEVDVIQWLGFLEVLDGRLGFDVEDCMGESCFREWWRAPLTASNSVCE